MLMALWVDLVRLSASLLLLSAFAAKWLGGPKSFVRSVEQYGVLPPRAASALAYLTLLAEVVVGAGLMVGQVVSAFLLLGGLLFLGFASMGLATMHRPQRGIADCGCLGKYVRLRLDSFSVAKNVLVATACFAGASANHFGTAAGLTPRSELPAAVVMASAALVAGMYWLSSYADTVISMVEDAFEARET
jgi:hypothetical protein